MVIGDKVTFNIVNAKNSQMAMNMQREAKHPLDTYVSRLAAVENDFTRSSAWVDLALRVQLEMPSAEEKKQETENVIERQRVWIARSKHKDAMTWVQIGPCIRQLLSEQKMLVAKYPKRGPEAINACKVALSTGSQPT